MSTDIVAIPFHGQTISSTEIDGKVYVAFKPIVESIGLDYASQHRRLTSHSWAGIVKMTIPSNGGLQEMTCVTLRTLTMWLATINENKVREEARPLVVAYQDEVADVLEAYWTKGGAINPRASKEQVQELRDQLEWQMKLCQLAKGLVHPDHLEAKADVILARGLGEAPEVDAADRLLYVSDFLGEKGLTEKRRKSIAGTFGKRVKAAYVREHGEEPKKYPYTLSNGQTRRVLAYTEADRSLLEAVWDEHYA